MFSIQPLTNPNILHAAAAAAANTSAPAVPALVAAPAAAVGRASVSPIRPRLASDAGQTLGSTIGSGGGGTGESARSSLFDGDMQMGTTLPTTDLASAVLPAGMLPFGGASSQQQQQQHTQQMHHLTKFLTTAPLEFVFKRVTAVLCKMPVTFNLVERWATINVQAPCNNGMIVIAIYVHQTAFGLSLVDFRKIKGNEREFYRIFREMCDKLSDIVLFSYK
nr:hypothetical protein HK105_002926 [Polyrhizophydium stewartii]